MGKALYRKYRSKTLDEIVGQPHITKTLKNSLEQGSFSHAYLFTGPRGTGKTSIARILAHEVNKLAYDEDANHLDIIEIDAASNRRIDEIRELRDRVHIAPTSAQFKVYIIDEVHMLTKEAFNALLKTLEEPPAHVIFMLATTEAHKLPETIVSRTQRFMFKPVDRNTVIGHLRYITEQENLKVSDDALDLIARHGGGSFRDSISLLDQVGGSGGAVEISDVQSVLGIAPVETIDQFIAILQNGTVSELLRELTSAREFGYQAGQIAKQLSERLRQYIIDGSSPISTSLITPTLHKLTNVAAAYDPSTSLEIALLDIMLSNEPKIEPAKQEVKSVAEAEPTPIKKSADKPTPIIKEVIAPAPKVEPKSFKAVAFDTDSWEEILTRIKKTHNTLYGMARMAVPQLNGDELTLVFKFAFHQKRLNEVKNKLTIADIVSDVLGKKVTIVCEVGTAETIADTVIDEPTTKSTISDDATISTISNIFGGAEVIE